MTDPRSLLRRALVPVVGVAALGFAAACWPAGSAAQVANTPMAGYAADAVDTTTSTTTTTVPTTTTEAPPPEEPPAPAPAPRRKSAPAPAPAAPAPEPAAPTASGAGGQGVSLANNFRAENGLPALAQAGDANAKAQAHAEEMAASGSMHHSSSLSSGLSPGWSAIGENVGVGPSISQIEAMFEQSSTHRNNLLGTQYNQIGFGWAQGADGRIYVCQVFVGR